MEEAFQFWGYGPQVFAETSGEGCALYHVKTTQPTPVFGRIELDDELIEHCGPLREACAAGWHTWLILDPACPPVGRPLAWFCESTGKRQTVITRTAENQWRFWFDLDATVRFVENETYLSKGPPVYLKLGINPAHLPERIRKLGFNAMHGIRTLRRHKKAPFPRRPSDPSVDCWRYVLRSIVEEHCGAEGVPLWPNGKQYAVALNHDIDTDYCFRKPAVLETFRRMEEDVGLRSAWMVVTKLLDAGRSALKELREAGHEIGFHGTHHDHKLAYLPPGEMAARINTAAGLLEAFDAKGIRSPAYLRTPGLYRALDGVFEYDMSMHDVIFSPLSLSNSHEGCCTCMPFFIDGTNLLEIPTTVPEDWTFDLQGYPFEQAWAVQTQTLTRIRACGGVANILTHPEPHHSIEPHWLKLYGDLIPFIAGQEDAWIATPGEINRHWRTRRAAIAADWARLADDPLPGRTFERAHACAHT